MVVVRGPSVGRGGLKPLIMVVVRGPSVCRGGLRCLGVKFDVVCIRFYMVFDDVLFGFYKVLYGCYKVAF